VSEIKIKSVNTLQQERDCFMQYVHFLHVLANEVHKVACFATLIYQGILQWKNFLNRLRIDRMMVMIVSVTPFLAHPVDGRARLSTWDKDEERVLRRGWTVMRSWRYEGWVVVRNPLYLVLFQILAFLNVKELHLPFVNIMNFTEMSEVFNILGWFLFPVNSQCEVVSACGLSL